MPIYAYECCDCGHSKDVLQKLSDKPLEVCPECGKKGFARKLTAAGFVLKGSGWYATDFRDGQKKESKDKKADKNVTNKSKSESNNESSGTKTTRESKGSDTKNTKKTQSKSV